MRVLFLGAPGAGKGTQAALLARRLGVPHLSTGDLFRQAVREGTPLGREAQAYMDRGELVPDAVVVGMVRERLQGETGFVLDGFPRTLPQARALEEELAVLAAPLDAAVLLEVPEELILRRLTARRLCRSCGAVYHLEFHPPRIPGRCDRCGGELYQRDDDREETVRRRLEVYRQETAPVAQFYRDRGLLRQVDGTGSEEEVSHRVASALGR
ncbi:MAG: adenylate kinase [Thermaerobacter sp.]|jgi:adenylate kinase|nr:adenylate kinase [Thermaerobacter sp.]